MHPQPTLPVQGGGLGWWWGEFPWRNPLKCASFYPNRALSVLLGVWNLVLTRPNPSWDGGGKPRVLKFPADPHLGRIRDIPTWKDSRAAECDIVKIIYSSVRLFYFTLNFTGRFKTLNKEDAMKKEIMNYETLLKITHAVVMSRDPEEVVLLILKAWRPHCKRRDARYFSWIGKRMSLR